MEGSGLWALGRSHPHLKMRRLRVSAHRPWPGPLCHFLFCPFSIHHLTTYAPPPPTPKGEKWSTDWRRCGPGPHLSLKGKMRARLTGEGGTVLSGPVRSGPVLRPKTKDQRPKTTATNPRLLQVSTMSRQ